MGKPAVIMHNSVSLDGRINNFPVNEELHYRIVMNYGADVYLAGSKTAKSGMELMGDAPPENRADFLKPQKDPRLSYWAIPDTKGTLKGMLHVLRRYEFCRDVIILVSKATRPDYLGYLAERKYDHLVCGEDRVDFGKAFDELQKKFGANKILVDSGPELGGVLLAAGLVDEISLVTAPCLVGSKAPSLYERLAIDRILELELGKAERLEKDHLWTVYKVRKHEQPA